MVLLPLGFCRRALGFLRNPDKEPRVLYPAQQSRTTDGEGEPRLDLQELRTRVPSDLKALAGKRTT